VSQKMTEQQLENLLRLKEASLKHLDDLVSTFQALVRAHESANPSSVSIAELRRILTEAGYAPWTELF
jgi:hypothetical protein